MKEEDWGEIFIPDVVPEGDREFVTSQSRYGNRVGWGTTPALLLVDVTKSFVGDCQTTPSFGTSISKLLSIARESKIPIVHTVPHDPSFPTGYPATIKGSPTSERVDADGEIPPSKKQWLENIDRIPSQFQPKDDELVIEKPRASAFFDTHLANFLHHHDVDTVVICGTTTSGCVRATAVDSQSSNFRTVVPKECVADTVGISHAISLFDMDLRYADVEELATVIDRIEKQRSREK